MRRLVVEADGGSRGNPGPAGYGAVVCDAGSGEVLAEVAESIGRATNNVAEYRGLIAGLTAAVELGGATGVEVEVRMDSKLVVEQMSGRWKIKHPDMQPLAREAQVLAASFERVSYSWVPRARNAHADRLANEAMDAAAEGRRWVRRTAPRESPGPEPEPRGVTRGTGWMAPTSRPTTTVLLRHGQTPLSVERRFSGVGDPELTEVGVGQAQAAAERFRTRGDVEAIVSSPLRRARQTAEVIAAGLDLPVRVEDGLRETAFGEWEGHTFAEIQQRWPDALAAWLADPTAAPPGGESFVETARRVCLAREALLARYPTKTVLVVSHVTPIKMLVREALQAPLAALYRMHLDVGCLCEVDWYADGPAVVRSLGDTCHLR